MNWKRRVHRGPDVTMSHELLLHRDLGSHGIQP
jgi:hypothetical protein